MSKDKELFRVLIFVALALFIIGLLTAVLHLFGGVVGVLIMALCFIMSLGATLAEFISNKKSTRRINTEKNNMLEELRRATKENSNNKIE